jgi:hypothetical protein
VYLLCQRELPKKARRLSKDSPAFSTTLTYAQSHCVKSCHNASINERLVEVLWMSTGSQSKSIWVNLSRLQARKMQYLQQCRHPSPDASTASPPTRTYLQLPLGRIHSTTRRRSQLPASTYRRLLFRPSFTH